MAANLRASAKNYNRDLAAAVKAGLIVTAHLTAADGSVDDAPIADIQPPIVDLVAIDRKHI